MKLLACHIDNFGKLCDVTLCFYNGLNVINEANGWGKSTFATFLKVMFYGLDTKKTAGAFEKERIMYRPWQGGAFGGELDFELDGKQYRISRTFGRTEKADEFHLYDLSTNLECYDFSENIGNEIFELDSASFKRSIYIVQNDCASEASDSINAKLGNLAENTDDINNFESANRQLKEILNQLTPDRVTGSIKKRKNYITQLSQELRSFESAQSGLEGIKAKEQQVIAEIQRVQDIRKNYTEALVAAGEDSRRKALYAQYDAMCQEVEEKERKTESYKTYFPAGIPTEEEFQTQLQNIAKINEMKNALLEYEFSAEEIEEYGRLSEMFENKVPEEEDIDAVLQVFQEIDKQKEEIVRQELIVTSYNAELEQKPEMPKFPGELAYKICLFIGIGIALAGAGALAAWYFNLLPMIDSEILLVAAVVAGACGVVLGIVSTIWGAGVSKKRRAWQKMTDEETEHMEDKVKSLNKAITIMKEDMRKVYGTIGNFLAVFHIYCEVSEYQPKLYELKGMAAEYLRMKERLSFCDSKKGAYEELHNKLLDFIQLYQFDLEKDEAYSLNQLRTKATEYHMADMAYKEACFKRENFEKQQEKSFWTRQALCPYSLEELNEWIAQADEKLENLKDTKNQYARQLENLQEQLDLRDEKETELMELHDAQKKDIQKYHVLKMTQEYLQQAKEQFTSRYMAPIAEGFAKYYGKLTGDDRQNWMIDANINLRIKEQGELRETHWLSSGFQDLIGVCMRLALVDAMYKEEKPFLILDDPFVNLDQEKLAAGNELLLEVAKEYQVIYFTCHDSRSPII